jgi:hypothetical protein
VKSGSKSRNWKKDFTPGQERETTLAECVYCYGPWVAMDEGKHIKSVAHVWNVMIVWCLLQPVTPLCKMCLKVIS